MIWFYLCLQFFVNLSQYKRFWMIQVVAGTVIAYFITFFLLPLIIRVADDNKLYDIPDERKTHKHEVSSLGGIAIFTGLILSLLLVSDFGNYSSELQYFRAYRWHFFVAGMEKNPWPIIGNSHAYSESRFIDHQSSWLFGNLRAYTYWEHLRKLFYYHIINKFF